MSKRGHILVTGGAGFIGSHLARRLLGAGCQVTVADNLSTGFRTNVPPGAGFIEIDLGDETQYGKLDGLRCDAVFHLAGQSSGEKSFLDPDYDLRSHVLSAFYLLKWCRGRGVRRFLYASSMSVYGDPSEIPVTEDHPCRPKSFYGAAKASAEQYIRVFQTLGIETTIFRLFNIYGPGQNMDNKLQGMASIYLSYMLEGKPICVRGAADRFRDFVFIDDLADAWMSAYQNARTFGKTYNLSTGTKTTVGRLLDDLRGAFGDPRYPVEFQPGTPGDQFGITGNSARLREDIGWGPRVDLQKGLTIMVNSFQKGAAR